MLLGHDADLLGRLTALHYIPATRATVVAMAEPVLAGLVA